MTTTTTAGPTTRRGGAAHPGPPLAAPAITCVVTFLASVLVGPLAGAGTTPSPYSSATTVVGHFATHRAATAVSGWLLVISAVALLFFSAVAYSRLTFLAPKAPGPIIAFAGGLLASVTLGVCGVTTWLSSREVVTGDARLVRAVHYLSFATGGPLHTTALGMLVAGLAVTSLHLRRTPRALSLVGVGIAGLCLLSTLSLVVAGAAPLVPAGRFTALAWLIVLSLVLPRERAARRG